MSLQHEPEIPMAPRGVQGRQERPVVLLITYTMLEPIVGGAFFRALRLACELHRRGWAPVICNNGPELEDPKVTRAKDQVCFVRLNKSAPGFGTRAARDQFASLQPRVVIMGESPFDAMKVFYEGAKRTGRPMIVLDQYYNDWLLPDKRDVGLILLYGLRSFWADDLRLRPPYVMVPPFIEEVTPKVGLPVPSNIHRYPWITFVAYDDRVLREGVKVLRGMEAPPAAVISISRTPGMAADLLAETGLDARLTVALPLQSDANLFGLIAASGVAMVSNGFIQIMDSLALGCPVIALKRADGPGLGSLNIDRRFHPYVSFDEGPLEQRGRLRQWLVASPFSADSLAALASERWGISRCADLVERLAAQWSRRTPWQRFWHRWKHQGG